jgi:hypothetical protein
MFASRLKPVCHKIYKHMNHEDVFVGSCFMYGFLSATILTKSDKKMSPMSSIGVGYAYAFLYGTCGLLLMELMPPPIRAIVPTYLCASMIYQINQKKKSPHLGLT